MSASQATVALPIRASPHYNVSGRPGEELGDGAGQRPQTPPPSRPQVWGRASQTVQVNAQGRTKCLNVCVATEAGDAIEFR